MIGATQRAESADGGTSVVFAVGFDGGCEEFDDVADFVLFHVVGLYEVDEL